MTDEDAIDEDDSPRFERVLGPAEEDPGLLVAVSLGSPVYEWL